MTAYLSLGSNIGDRRAHIERAVALISRAWPQCGVRCSSSIESEPWGYESDHAYINACVALDGFEGDPLELLDSLQAIEREISPMPHRKPDGSYADREIDIDIVAIDGIVMDTPRLTLPHPRAAERLWVMEPLRELLREAPGTQRPQAAGTGDTAAAYLSSRRR